MLSPVQSRPCDTTGVLALEEEGFGFAVLEAEDFVVTTDVKLALNFIAASSAWNLYGCCTDLKAARIEREGLGLVIRGALMAREVDVPCLDRSSHH